MPANTLFPDIRRMFNEIFVRLFCIEIWINYSICLCKGAAATAGLAYTLMFVDYAVVSVMITYFTDTWEEHSLPNAVAIINFKEGLSSVLVLVTVYISENHFTPLKVIFWSVAAYVNGMVMLCISALYTMPVVYFVLAVVLISVGKAGGVPILEEFLVSQLRAHEPRPDIDEERVNARKKVWWITASLLCSFSTIPWIFGAAHAGWLVKLIYSTSVMGIGFFLFLCCIPLYHRSSDEAVVTTSETPCASPQGNTNNGQTPAVSAGRRLMEQWMPLSTMIPMWTTFLIYGLVLSTGDSFFAEQVNNMSPTELPKNMSPAASIYILKIIRTSIKGLIVGIWIAMVVCIFCCSVAWRVEVRRLRAIADSGFCRDNEEHYFFMSMMRMAPQFCLLGLMEGSGKELLDLFFEVQVADVTMEKYRSALNEAVLGIGSFLNALLVFHIKSWFGDTLNCSSRLDNYYQLLMILSFVNLCYYWYVSTLYWNKKEETKDDVEVEETGGVGAV